MNTAEKPPRDRDGRVLDGGAMPRGAAYPRCLPAYSGVVEVSMVSMPSLTFISE
jgi:hypothetical protein